MPASLSDRNARTITSSPSLRHLTPDFAPTVGPRVNVDIPAAAPEPMNMASASPKSPLQIKLLCIVWSSLGCAEFATISLQQHRSSRAIPLGLAAHRGVIAAVS